MQHPPQKKWEGIKREIATTCPLAGLAMTKNHTSNLNTQYETTF